jgi:hypothetical protein
MGNSKIDKYGVGKYVIIRTYSAGVWMGKVEEKDSTQVILTDARRMHYFKCLDDGDSLSHIALNGIHPDSQINGAVPSVLLQWIEILPISDNAKLTFDAQPYFKVT